MSAFIEGRLNPDKGNLSKSHESFTVKALQGDLREAEFGAASKQAADSNIRFNAAEQAAEFSELLRKIGAKVTLRAPTPDYSSNLIETAVEDLEQAFAKLSQLPPAVTVFGSARLEPGDKYYQLVVDIGRELVRAGFAVVTGGGPGLMEAANKGAREEGGVSVGLNIILPKEQGVNQYVDISHEFDDFFTRKLTLRHYSCAFVAAPGGFGTLDELFEILTLRQTGKIKDYPVVLVGKEYWQPLLQFLRDTVRDSGLISVDDLDDIIVTDCPKVVASHIRSSVIKDFGIREELELPKAA